MKRSAFVVVVFVMLSTACASVDMHPHFAFAFTPAANPKQVLVRVDDGVIVVNQEPIRVRRNLDPVIINWLLNPAHDYVFPPTTNDPPPIAFQIDPPLPRPPVCTVATDRKTLSCAYPHPGRKKFRYTLAIVHERDRSVLISDPSVYND